MKRFIASYRSHVLAHPGPPLPQDWGEASLRWGRLGRLPVRLLLPRAPRYNAIYAKAANAALVAGAAATVWEHPLTNEPLRVSVVELREREPERVVSGERPWRGPFARPVARAVLAAVRLGLFVRFALRTGRALRTLYGKEAR